MLLSPAILRANPWWRNREAIEHDPDIRVAARAPAASLPPIPFRLDRDALYMVRGPRQVGKTTLLKRVVQVALRNPGIAPHAVLYFDFSRPLIAAAPRLGALVRIHRQLAREHKVDGRLILLLDEISGIKHWQRTWDACRGITVIVTCANTTDGVPAHVTDPSCDDWTLMPLGFREYLAAYDPPLAAMLPSIDLGNPRTSHAAAQEIVRHRGAVRAWLRRYLVTGGFAAGVTELRHTGCIGAGAYERQLATLGKDLARRELRVPPLQAIVAWAANRHLGQDFSRETLSATTDVGASRTAHRCLDGGANLFLWHLTPRARAATTALAATRAAHRLYPIDPFAWHALASWATGDPDPWAASVARTADRTTGLQLAEAVAAGHFIRAYAPLTLYHKVPRRGEVIDLVGHRAGAIRRVVLRCRADVTRLEVKRLATHGGGLIATRDAIRFDAPGNVAQIPLYALLAGYDEPITLFPTRQGARRP
jgi:predicted AAA+ superfamily ATPase